MARIAGIDLPKDKRVVIALTYIYGIGTTAADKIISSTNPKDVGKWLTSKKKELIFKAQLGKTVTGEGHAYNVIIPVIVREKQYGYINLIINTEEFSALMRERLIERIIAALFVFGAGTLFIV